jgi:hypothetical protein
MCVCISIYVYNICLLLHKKRGTEAGNKRRMNFPPTVFDVEH